MSVSVLATAEPGRSWDAISRSMQGVLGAIGAEWRELVPYPGRPQQQASIFIGPGGPIGVRLREGLLLLHASTTPGPGYHERVVEVLDALVVTLPQGWLRIADTTGYADHRDPDLLRRAFLRWAVALREGVNAAGPSGSASISLCLGLGQGPAEVPNGLVATPIGFRSLGWLEAMHAGLQRALAEPGRPLSPEARAAFLWWNRDPDGFDWSQLGRAICTSEVIWGSIPGEEGPDQVEARERAVSCLERALALDPTSPAPVEELRRLYRLLGRDADAARVALNGGGHEPFRGGYRQGWIRRPLPGQWHVQMPGWLRARCDDTDGHDVFWDDRMTVHVTTARARSFEAREQVSFHLEQLPATARDRARVEFLSGDAVQGYVVTLPYGPDVPDVDSLVSGQVAAAGERATFTVVARSPEASAMALRLGRSLRPLV